MCDFWDERDGQLFLVISINLNYNDLWEDKLFCNVF